MAAAYVHTAHKGASSTQRVHVFDRDGAVGPRWPAEPTNKTHNLRQDEFMAHANKCLQLGEKSFKSGGMKLSGKE